MQQAREQPHFTGVTYSFHRTESLQLQGRLSASVLCSPQQKAHCPCLCMKSESRGRSRSLTSWHFVDPDVQVYFRGLRLAPAPRAWPPRRSSPPQGLALCFLSWEVSWPHSGWMLELEQQELFLENLVLGCTDRPASETALNRKHLCFWKKKIRTRYQ